MKVQQSHKARTLAWALMDKDTGEFIVEYFDKTPLLFKTKKEAGFEKRDHEKAVKVEIKEVK